jgi:hypothetical protein
MEATQTFGNEFGRMTYVFNQEGLTVRVGNATANAEMAYKSNNTIEFRTTPLCHTWTVSGYQVTARVRIEFTIRFEGNPAVLEALAAAAAVTTVAALFLSQVGSAIGAAATWVQAGLTALVSGLAEALSLATGVIPFIIIDPQLLEEDPSYQGRS